jgi:hypothetical protein
MVRLMDGWTMMWREANSGPSPFNWPTTASCTSVASMGEFVPLSMIGFTMICRQRSNSGGGAVGSEVELRMEAGHVRPMALAWRQLLDGA